MTGLLPEARRTSGREQFPLFAPSTVSETYQRIWRLRELVSERLELLQLGRSRALRARGFAVASAAAYWESRCAQLDCSFEVLACPPEYSEVSAPLQILAREAGALAAQLTPSHAAFAIGHLYSSLLPEDLRTELGAFFTPPALASRLLDLALLAGCDPDESRILDPSAGAGAFLVAVAERAVAAHEFLPAELRLETLESRLHGIEIDPFSAWLANVFVESAALPLCVATGRRLSPRVRCADALLDGDNSTYDLVIGNPPYGRVKLREEQRANFSRSLFGHANMYGLFTDLALRWTRPGGAIAFLTPTSFLGGQYYSALRRLLRTHATPAAFEFVASRNGVFEGVLQETVLVSYRLERCTNSARVAKLTPRSVEHLEVVTLGESSVRSDGSPWIIPREPEQVKVARSLAGLPNRLPTIGYRVSTGPLVWNRHRTQIRARKTARSLPIVWAESISEAGFALRADRRTEAQFIETRGARHLVTSTECLLVQRTTSKEQQRRLLCAILPQAVIEEHDGVVVENHVNMIVATGAPAITLATLAAILNSKAADTVFRCISGSVAVSAYELESLPLPSTEALLAVQKAIHSGAPTDSIESLIMDAFFGRDA